MDTRKFVRNLRKNMTNAEKLLWEELRNRKLLNKKFVRQYPITYQDIMGCKSIFIADFYCAEYKLVIELDGEVHNHQIEVV